VHHLWLTLNAIGSSVIGLNAIGPNAICFVLTFDLGRVLVSNKMKESQEKS
jgi:hypothetical protein